MKVFFRIGGERVRNSISRKLFVIFNYLFLTFYALMVVFPFMHLLTISLSHTADLRLGFQLFPQNPTLDAYKAIFSNRYILIQPFLNSIYVTVTGVAIALIMHTTFAYVLAKKDLKGLNLILVYIMIPWFFSGGMIPEYLLIKKLGMINTYWALTVPSAISFGNLLLVRNYMRSIPESLSESARLDGANEFQILMKVIVPLSAPILAAIGLFEGVGLWNQYFKVILYIHDPKKMTLQVVLRSLVLESAVPQQTSGGIVMEVTENVKMAMTVVGMIPVLLVYPFIQKHFTKGIIVGSIKG